MPYITINDPPKSLLFLFSVPAIAIRSGEMGLVSKLLGVGETYPMEKIFFHFKSSYGRVIIYTLYAIMYTVR